MDASLEDFRLEHRRIHKLLEVDRATDGINVCQTVQLSLTTHNLFLRDEENIFGMNKHLRIAPLKQRSRQPLFLQCTGKQFKRE